jgi:hypothetical protein
MLRPAQTSAADEISALSLSVLTRTINDDWDMSLNAWLADIAAAGGASKNAIKPRIWSSAMRLSLNTMLLNRITRMASDNDAYEHGPPGGKMAISSQPAFHHCLNAATTVLDSMASLAREQLTYASDTLLHFALYAATFLLQVCRTNKSRLHAQLCRNPSQYRFESFDVAHTRGLILQVADALQNASAYHTDSPALHARCLRRLCRTIEVVPRGEQSHSAAMPLAPSWVTQPPQTMGTFSAPTSFDKSPLDATLGLDLDALLGTTSWTGLESLWQPDSGVSDLSAYTQPAQQMWAL